MTVNTLLNGMKKHASYLSFTLLILQASCIAQQTGSQTLNDVYMEDLTQVRPSYEVKKTDSVKDSPSIIKQAPQATPTHTVNSKVNTVLDSLDKLNRLRTYIDGFTIQIYSGPNREDAISTKAKMVKAISDLEADIQYTQPKFRVTAGKYYSKLEAQKDLMRLKDYFPNAILLPEKIQVK